MDKGQDQGEGLIGVVCPVCGVELVSVTVPAEGRQIGFEEGEAAGRICARAFGAG